MNILVVGQSHVAAVRAAARIRREAEPTRPRTRVIHTLEPQYAPEIDGDALAPALAQAIGEQIARHRPRVASVMGGNFHNALALVRHERPFDFRLADDDALDAHAQPIPETLVRAALTQGLARDFLRLRLLREVAGPFLHLESPPPVADEALIRDRADAWFRARGGPDFAVAPAGLRMRMWRLNSALFRAEVERLGCTFLPAPPLAQDGAGFLRAGFAGDATHGNEAYGEAAIRCIEAAA